MVATVEYLTERTLTKSIYDFISISKMIMVDNEVIPSIIIIAIVVSRDIRSCGLLLALRANGVDCWIVEDLFTFILRQVTNLTTLENS